MAPETDPCAAAVDRLTAGIPPSRREAHDIVETVFAGRGAVDAFGRWLTLLADRPPDAEVIAGVAAAVRGRMVPVPHDLPLVADTCGTGGDGSDTFNISTAAAIVAAAAGLRVAKHGNRAVSSRTGSADVLASLGVRIDADAATSGRCLRETGICFCLAPLHHPAMALVGPLRRSLGRPTVFNAIGPLCNPAGATVQVVGVGRPALREPLALAAANLGVKRMLVVSGALAADGTRSCDEVSVFGPTDVIDVRGGRLHPLRWEPADFGLARRAEADLAGLAVDGPEASAAIIRRVLAGERGAAREMVAVNAAAVLWAAGHAATPAEGCRLALDTIDGGAAGATLARLAAATHDSAWETGA
ncbi:MAG: anthranilate phosphoribosyltransferase [Pirellulales bacterium]